MVSPVPLDELVASFVETGLRSLEEFGEHDLPAQHALADKTREMGTALLARGESGTTALRSLMNDPRVGVQYLGAAWLVKADPDAAAPTLRKLKRKAGGTIGAEANLALMQARDLGLIGA